MKEKFLFLLLLSVSVLLHSCGVSPDEAVFTEESRGAETSDLNKYTEVRLTTDLSLLSQEEKEIIPILIEAAQEMDEAFWKVAYGDKSELIAGISDPELREFALINYGPWDRLEGNSPFIEGFGSKPKGANFYPADMTKEEFEAVAGSNPSLRSLYTLVRRDAEGNLVAVPYHQGLRDHHSIAAEKLEQAAELSSDPGFRRYLNLRAEALRTDEFRESDFAWMDMKDNGLDIVIGPIETYEDQLFGFKAAHEAFVLVKDKEWSQRLARYVQLLPGLQRDLPVPDEYKAETPGSDSDLNAYDVIYYAGDCNAGSKTIAINLPNDEEVQLEKGTRRLQLKNAMKAKFDKILVPIADVLIAPELQKHITFQAFFGNIMFHEVAHGLGIKNTLTGKGRVRQAMKDQASSLEENKADVLGLFMVSKLFDQGEIEQGSIEDHYVTFLAGIFRSIRFGTSSAHARANLARFNFFKSRDAFSRDQEGRYSVNFDKMKSAIDELSAIILKLQGDGDYEGAAAFMKEMGQSSDVLENDLQRVARAGIPVDIVFEQGTSVLGLQ